jgi:phage portal protein BeeE
MTSLLADALEQSTSFVTTLKQTAARRVTHDLPDVESAMLQRTSLFGTSSYDSGGDYYQHFKNWIYIAVDSIASAVAGLPWKAAEIVNAEANPERRPTAFREKIPAQIRNKATSGQEFEAIASHPVLDLLAEPNATQGCYEFLYFTVANLEIVGRAHWILGTDDDGKEERLFAVPTTWVKYHRKEGMYYLQVEGEHKKIPIPPEYIATAFFPDPSDPFGCYSKVRACLPAVRVDNHIQSSQEIAFDRGIYPNLIVTVGKTPGSQQRPTLTGAQRRQFVRAVREIWSQTVNIGDPAVVDGLIDSVHKLHSSPQEMDWPASGEIVKDRIVQTFRVNPYIFGQVTGVNRAQAAVAQEVFNDKVVNPLAGKLSNAATSLLGPRYETPQRLMLYLEEAKAVDREQRLREWASLRRSGDVTQSEIRAAIAGLAPLEARDDPSTLLNLVGGLNGIIALQEKVNLGLISRDQAIATLTDVLRLSEDQAAAIIGTPIIPPQPELPPPPAPERSKSIAEDKAAFRAAIEADHVKRFETAEGDLGQALARFFRRHHEGVDTPD